MSEREYNDEFVENPGCTVVMTGIIGLPHIFVHEVAQEIQKKALGEVEMGEILTIASMSLAMGALAGATYQTLCNKGICKYDKHMHVRWNMIGATGLNMIVAISELSSALSSAIQS